MTDANSQRAVIYCRVSTDEETQELGMEAQLRDCQRYCAATGIEIVQIYQESISGASKFEDRFVLHDAIRKLRESGASLLLMQKVDRFARDLAEAQKILREIRSAKARVHFVQTGGTDTAIQELQFNILMAVGQFERENIRERIVKAMSVKRDRGEYLGGKIPYGKRTVEVERLSSITKKVETVKFLEDNPEELNILQRLRDLRAQGMSYRGIADKLFVEGVRFRKGGKMDAEWIRKKVGRVQTAPYGSCSDESVRKYEQEILVWIAEATAKGLSSKDILEHLNQANTLTRDGKPVTIWWVRKRISEIQKIFSDGEANEEP